MKALLALSRLIDRLNHYVGQAAYWLVLAMVLLSAGNAIIRKALDTSSNAYLEMQWYLFAALFLLSGGYALLKHEHVRIDLLYQRCPRRTQIWIDILGTLFFLLPFGLLLLILCWPYFMSAWQSNETSANAGGLTLWWVKAFMPAGFLLLVLQGVSELIKRIAFLAGAAPDPGEAHDPPAELELAQNIHTDEARQV